MLHTFKLYIGHGLVLTTVATDRHHRKISTLSFHPFFPRLTYYCLMAKSKKVILTVNLGHLRPQMLNLLL